MTKTYTVGFGYKTQNLVGDLKEIVVDQNVAIEGIIDGNSSKSFK